MQLSPAGPPRVKKFAKTPPTIPAVKRQEAKKLALRPKLNLLPTKGRMKKFQNIMKDMINNKTKENKHFRIYFHFTNKQLFFQTFNSFGHCKLDFTYI